MSRWNIWNEQYSRRPSKDLLLRLARGHVFWSFWAVVPQCIHGFGAKWAAIREIRFACVIGERRIHDHSDPGRRRLPGCLSRQDRCKSSLDFQWLLQWFVWQYKATAYLMIVQHFLSRMSRWWRGRERETETGTETETERERDRDRDRD